MDLEFLMGRTNQWVPILNGLLLHSSVDPAREAASFVNQEWPRIKDVQSLIVFGLGGGFHIEELLRRKKFDIIVVEAEKSLAQAMKEKKPELMKRIETLAGITPAQIYQEAGIIRAVSRSYAHVRHPASQRAAPFYYGPVLQVLSQRTLSRLCELSEGNPRLNQFLKSLNISTDQILTLPMVEEAMVRRGQGLEREGLIWMAMRELVV
jgi:hypothetical protein